MWRKESKRGRTTRGTEETHKSEKKKRIMIAKELARESQPDRQRWKVQMRRKK